LYTDVGDGPDVENVIRQSAAIFERVLVVSSATKKRKIDFPNNVEAITASTIFHLTALLFSRRNDYRIAHVFCGLIPTIPLIIVILKLLKKRVVYSSFGQLLPLGLRRHYFRKKIFTTLLLFPVLRLIDAIHISSNFEGTNLPKNVTKVKSYLPVFEAKDRLAGLLNREHKEYAFLFFGRFDVWQKGLDILMPALASFYIKGGSRKKTCLSGRCSSNEEKKLRELVVQYKLEKFVDIFPNVTPNERDRLYQSSEFFVHPSRVEGFARSMRDAVSIGLPIITTQDSNAPDNLKEHQVALTCRFEVTALTALLWESRDCCPNVNRYADAISELSPEQVAVPLINFIKEVAEVES